MPTPALAAPTVVVAANAAASSAAAVAYTAAANAAAANAAAADAQTDAEEVRVPGQMPGRRGRRQAEAALCVDAGVPAVLLHRLLHRPRRIQVDDS